MRAFYIYDIRIYSRNDYEHYSYLKLSSAQKCISFNNWSRINAIMLHSFNDEEPNVSKIDSIFSFLYNLTYWLQMLKAKAVIITSLVRLTSLVYYVA